MVHWHRSFCRVSVLSHVVRQSQAGLQTQAILMLLHRYICESSGPGTMLAARRSAGVTPDVNLISSLHIGDEVCKQGAQSGFETQGGLH